MNTTIDVNRLIEMYEAHTSYDDIARTFDVTNRGVRRLVAELVARGDLVRHPNGVDWTDAMDARLAEEYTAGKSYAVMADLLGVSQNAVQSRLETLDQRGLIKRRKHIVRPVRSYEARSMTVRKDTLTEADIQRGRALYQKREAERIERWRRANLSKGRPELSGLR